MTAATHSKLNPQACPNSFIEGITWVMIRLFAAARIIKFIISLLASAATNTIFACSRSIAFNVCRSPTDFLLIQTIRSEGSVIPFSCMSLSLSSSFSFYSTYPYTVFVK